MTKKILIMLGPAGSGKSTQDKLVEKEFGYKPFIMGDILREEAKKETALGKKIHALIKDGHMVSLEIASDLIFEKVKRSKAKKILMDGFPREFYQSIVFDYFIKTNNYKLMGVIHLNLSRKESIKRLLLRKRSDDDLKAINQRLDDYHKITKKAIDKYRKEKKLIEINGEQTIDNVFKEIKTKLNKIKGI